uniref:Ig-like domain-containing protein n=2 Tax=Schistocephalus solidus TaxID=70667 RepID=A0A0V0JAE0_SCHSO
MRPNVPVFFGDLEPPEFLCESLENRYCWHNLIWSYVSGKELMQPRGNRLVAGINARNHDSGEYHCKYKENIVLKVKMHYVESSQLIFTPDVGVITSLNVPIITCRLKTSHYLQEYISIDFTFSYQIKPFEIRKNTLKLKSLTHGNWTYKCQLSHPVYTLEISHTFRIVLEVNITITPDQLIMYSNQMKNITCSLRPPEAATSYEITWKRLNGCPSHYVNPYNKTILEPATDVLPCTATYMCEARGGQNKLTKIHTIVIAHESLSLVGVDSPVVYVGEGVPLQCHLFPEWKVPTDVDWEFSPSGMKWTTNPPARARVKFVTWMEQGLAKVKCHVPERTAVWSTIYVLNRPQLSLANKENTVLLVGIGKPAECVAYADPSPPLPYPRLPTWVKNSKYPEAEIRGNLLLFSKAPPKNQAKFQCKYQHHGISVSREFTFEVYELWQLVSNQLKASDSVLQLGEAYQDTCSTKALTRNLKSTTSNFSDLVVEQAAGANFKVHVQGNQVQCKSPKKWACFTLTCNNFLLNIRLPPVRRTRCYIEKGKVSMVPHPKTVIKGSTLRCDCTAEPRHYIRMEWTAKSITGREVPMDGYGNLGIIPPNFPGRSATVTCKAYFLINGVRTPVGEDKTSIELSDIIDVDLNYTNAEGLSPGETVACPDPSTIFLPDDAAWNGFAVQDKRTVQVPQKINTGVHLMGCEVRTNRAWTRKAYTLPIIVRKPEIHLSSYKVTVNEKFRCYAIGSNSRHFLYKVRNLQTYTYGNFCPAADSNSGILKFDPICPVGLQKIQCTVYGDPRHGIPETSRILEINLLGYDPILTEDDIVLTPMPLRTIIMFWILWFFVLAFNVAFMAYIFNQNSLYRITQMQVMNRRRTGGTRLNRRMENMPFVYIQRSELDGQLFRRLRLIIDLYRGFLELGDRWLLLWTMNKKEIRLKMLKHFREFLERGERIGRPSVREGARSRYVLSTFLSTDSAYARGGQSTNFGPRNAGPRASVKK